MPFVARYILPYRTAFLWLLGFLLFAVFITVNKDFNTFFRYFLLGLPQGAIIALIAVGYSMVYGIIQLINFAHGEVFMFSTYFVLMFISAASPTDNTTPIVISVMVLVMFLCTAWMLLAFIEKKMVRMPIALAIGMVAAVANYYLMPGVRNAVLPFFAAYAVAVVYSCCLGVSMDQLAYKPLRGSPRLIPLITAIGISLFLQNFAQSTWGSASKFFPSSMVPQVLQTRGDTRLDVGKALRIAEPGQLAISLLDVVIIGLALFLMIALQLFILRTRTGKSMRACAQDRTTAALMGIKVNRVVALTFALGAGLAALVAPLYVIRGTPIFPQMGYIVGILAFASAVLGGIGNITGAMLGGLIIGIIYSFVPLFDALTTFTWFQAAEKAGWVTSEGYRKLLSRYGGPSQYQLGVAYAFMIAVIVFKPTGLLGKASAKRA